MWSHGNGSLSATTQVKVLSPENILVASGQGFHFLETNIRTPAKGEGISDEPGSESVAGERIVYIGTWENRNVPQGSSREAEEATRGYGVSVVGPIRSRGVNGVMPVESRGVGLLEGFGSSTQRDEVCHARH
jgi:hypothetical protein